MPDFWSFIVHLHQEKKPNWQKAKSEPIEQIIACDQSMKAWELC